MTDPQRGTTYHVSEIKRIGDLLNPDPQMLFEEALNYLIEHGLIPNDKEYAARKDAFLAEVTELSLIEPKPNDFRRLNDYWIALSMKAWRNVRDVPIQAQSGHQTTKKAKSTKKGAKRQPKQPNEHDRIRTTLMTWAKESGKCSSYADAAAQLGIDIDTRRNHERDGWLYTDAEMQERGGYEALWKLYTTKYRKS